MENTLSSLDLNTVLIVGAIILAGIVIALVALIISNRGLSKELSILSRSYTDMGNRTGDMMEARLSDMNRRISDMAFQNEASLEKMRQTVDDKLQKTLDDKLSSSFGQVSDRLEQVYKGFGEMQTLAQGVGDLKKVLSNVKTRGTLGELQLGAILGQILSKEQYAENIATKPGSSDRVEFAVKLPGEGERPVYLPIDSKFPGERYAKLRDASESGNRELVEAAWKALEQVIKAEAKDISEKYIAPPYTTDFAVMFLPFEGLYSEVVNRGMIEVLQRDYHVNIAGPATMAALLSSLQMGFRTLAIEKHSSEVWEILGAVKTEFANFSTVLDSTRKRLRQADEDLDKLVGARTRAIEKKLRSVEAMSHADLDDEPETLKAIYGDFDSEDQEY